MQNNPYQAPAYQQAAYGGQPTAAGGTYEFNDLENQTIDKLARRSRLWGLFALISGGIGLIGLGAMGLMMEQIARELPNEMENVLPLALIGLAPLVLVNLIIGGLYMQAGGALKKVVNTQGNDIELALEGIKKLGGAFMIEAIVTVISVVIGFVAGLAIAATM